jgi:Flp pilus assembly protein TadB
MENSEKRSRRKKRIITITVVLSVLALMFAYLAYQDSQAGKEKKRADAVKENSQIRQEEQAEDHSEEDLGADEWYQRPADIKDALIPPNSIIDEMNWAALEKEQDKIAAEMLERERAADEYEWWIHEPPTGAWK